MIADFPSLTFRGQLEENASLAEFTSWRVGGPADLLFQPVDLEDLISFMQQLPQHLPITWLGLGSNVLIRDGGVRGLVVVTQKGLHGLSIENNIVRAEAGVSCAQLARYTARLGFTGLEFMAGIPGTVGGALRMNAGCFGGETWQKVTEVELINKKGEISRRERSLFEYGYRHVNLKNDEWFVAGHFSLTVGDKDHSLNEIKRLLERRNSTQPTGLPNCGSVFRNPENNFAAKLIEQCGLKNKKIGGAYVSEKHANFIINDGQASAHDIEMLINDIREIVLKKEGVALMPEVCMIGEPAKVG